MFSEQVLEAAERVANAENVLLCDTRDICLVAAYGFPLFDEEEGGYCYDDDLDEDVAAVQAVIKAARAILEEDAYRKRIDAEYTALYRARTEAERKWDKSWEAAVESAHKVVNQQCDERDTRRVAIHGFPYLTYSFRMKHEDEHVFAAYKNGVLIFLDEDLDIVVKVAPSTKAKITFVDGKPTPGGAKWLHPGSFKMEVQDKISDLVEDIFVDAAKAILKHEEAKKMQASFEMERMKSDTEASISPLVERANKEGERL